MPSHCLLQKEVGKWREQLEDMQQQLDRVHVAHQEAEEEEAVLQQLKLACLLPAEQDHEAAALHQLSGEHHQIALGCSCAPLCMLELGITCCLVVHTVAHVAWEWFLILVFGSHERRC